MINPGEINAAGTGASEEFEGLINKLEQERLERERLAHLEQVLPRSRDIRAHEAVAKPENKIELDTLQVGDEVTLEFYPSSQDPEPEKMTLTVKEVRGKAITAIASGGPEKWVDKEVRVGCSTFSPYGSMAKSGVIEVGLCPEFHFDDDEQYQRLYQELEALYTPNHEVFINGIKFDDTYFDEYRTDLNLPTTKERIDWLARVSKFAHRSFRTEPVADFKIDKPQQVDFSAPDSEPLPPQP